MTESQFTFAPAVNDTIYHRAAGIYRRAVASGFVRQLVETLGTRVLTLAIGLLTSILVARLLGPEGRGLVAAAAALAAIGVQFGNLGLHASNTYYAGREPQSLPVLIGNSLLVSFAIGGGCALSAWMLFLLWPGLLPLRGGVLLVALITIPFGLAFLLLQNLLLGIREVRVYNLIELVTKVSYVVLIGVTIALHVVTVESILVVGVIVTAWAGLGAFLLLTRHARCGPAVSYRLFTDHIRYGFKAYVAAFCAFLVLKVDLLMVQSLLGAGQAGYYSVASSMADMLYIVPTAAGAVLFPRLAAMADTGDRWRVARTATWALGVVMLPLTALAGILAHPLIRLLYGEAFLPAVASFQILCVAMVVYGAGNMVSIHLAASGFPTFVVLAWGIVCGMNVCINLWLIPRCGIEGAALTSLICYSSILVLEYLYAARLGQGIKNERNFEALYAGEADPWQIGAADSERYNRYYDLIAVQAASRRSILDIGCGLGAFLARFKGDFERLSGVELSQHAIQRGQDRFPFIDFHQGSAAHLAQSMDHAARFDAIIYSDVITYLDEADKRSSLQWIAEHLAPGGIALIAAWCPGGDQYLTFDELKRLVERDMVIESEDFLESEHAVFSARRKQHFVAITIDYETWHPIPKGRRIDWDDDVFNPTEQLMQVCGREQVPLTLMAEMGQYFWLCEYEPAIARRMEQQWKEAIRLGNDVQVHLHPCWLPGLGAGYQNGHWTWDWSKSRADDYPGDLTALIGRCKTTLENLLRPVNPGYRVNSFRAGAFQAQPFKRLHEALAANGIFCDSSVYAGGHDPERGVDFRLAYSDHLPYYANAYDPQLKAPPAELQVIEIPIFTLPRRFRPIHALFRVEPNQRWCLDGTEGPLFARRLLDFLKHSKKNPTTESARQKTRLARGLSSIYSRLRRFRPWLNPLLLKSLAHTMASHGPESLVGNEYFVMIGHSKGKHDFAQISANLQRLKQDGRCEFLTLARMADTAKAELGLQARRSARQEAMYQVNIEYGAVMGDERNQAQSHHLQEMIPLDRKTVLDLGCGAGYWSARIAEMHPGTQVTGIDRGREFIAKAEAQFRSGRVSFLVADFAELPFRDAAFDCIYADNSLEHCFDVDGTLTEALRILRPGGVLIAAVPSDARNPTRICENHTWKTAPHEVQMRLAHVGFGDVTIQEIDVFRKLGMSPYPPSDDKMMFIEAWKPAQAGALT